MQAGCISWRSCSLACCAACLVAAPGTPQCPPNPWRVFIPKPKTPPLQHGRICTTARRRKRRSWTAHLSTWGGCWRCARRLGCAAGAGEGRVVEQVGRRRREGADGGSQRVPCRQLWAPEHGMRAPGGCRGCWLSYRMHHLAWLALRRRLQFYETARQWEDLGPLEEASQRVDDARAEVRLLSRLP